MVAGVQAEIKKAVDILLQHGATEIYLFGSHVRGDAGTESDVDLAIRGMPPEHFFRAVGEICATLSIATDVIDLDESSPTLDYLKKHGEFLRVA